LLDEHIYVSQHSVLWSVTLCCCQTEGGSRTLLRKFGAMATPHTKASIAEDVQRTRFMLSQHGILRAPSGESDTDPLLHLTRGPGKGQDNNASCPVHEVIRKSNLSGAIDAAEASQFELMPETGKASEGKSRFETTEPTDEVQNTLPAGSRAGPAVESVLATMELQTIRLSNKLSCARRGVTPTVVKALTHRLRLLRDLVTDIDLSHNPLSMSGLLHLMQALGDLKHVKRLNLSSCDLNFVPEFRVLKEEEIGRGLGELEVSAAERSDSELGREEEASTEADVARQIPSVVNVDGRKQSFYPKLLSIRVFMPNEEEEEEEEEEVEEALKESGQAALLFKEFLCVQTALEHLSMCDNDLGVGGMYLLSRAVLQPGISQSLRDLDLSSCLIGVRGAGEALQQVLGCCKALIRLSIAKNAIRGDDAVNVLYGIRDCSSLEEIYAAHNGFGEDSPAQALGELLKSPAVPNLWFLDLSFNRFRGFRTAPWPEKFKQKAMYSHTLHILDSLLPMLSRFGKGDDPARIVGISPLAKTVNGTELKPRELDCYRRIYEELSSILDEDLSTMEQQMNDASICQHEHDQSTCAICGTFSGSVRYLLSGMSSVKERSNLKHLLLGGNFLSEEMVGTILHVFSKLIRVTHLDIDSMHMESKWNDDIHAVVRPRRTKIVPKSTFLASGYPVLDVRPNMIRLSCGVDFLELQSATSLELKHFCETGLKFSKFSKRPQEMDGLIATDALVTFVPEGQRAFEKQLEQRIAHRLHSLKATRESVSVPQPFAKAHNPEHEAEVMQPVFTQEDETDVHFARSIVEGKFDEGSYTDEAGGQAATSMGVSNARESVPQSSQVEQVGEPSPTMSQALTPLSSSTAGFKVLRKSNPSTVGSFVRTSRSPSTFFRV
jgi:hypothetical protein